jgi:hypothetical protein
MAAGIGEHAEGSRWSPWPDCRRQGLTPNEALIRLGGGERHGTSVGEFCRPLQLSVCNQAVEPICQARDVSESFGQGAFDHRIVAEG